MRDLVDEAVRRLRVAGVGFEPGLSDQEVDRLQDVLGFEFGPEHRAFLQTGVPTGEPAWPNWRGASLEVLRGRLDWPLESAIFDLRHNDFWPASWGARPDDEAERIQVARYHLALAPRLVPLFSHRYLTADPIYQPSPVFSVYQTDVIYYGATILNWVEKEFEGKKTVEPWPPVIRVPFWSDLAVGAESEDLEGQLTDQPRRH